MHIGSDRLRVGASAGIVFYPNDGLIVKDLVSKADLALYQVKERGGRGIEFFNPNELASSCFESPTAATPDRTVC